MKVKVYKILWNDFLEKPEIINPVLNKLKSNLKGKVAVKIHFGEPGNDNAFRGPVIKPVTDWIAENHKEAFLTDTNTLYTGFRSETHNHLQTAKEHGFLDLNLPVEIDDEEFPEFKLSDLKHKHQNLPIRLGKKLMEADSIFCISHLKGHGMFGFGGALKNLGMGGAVPRGKKVLHANFAGQINQDLCIKCLKCLNNCPATAITFENNQVKINHDKCIGCGECVTVCPQSAVEVSEKDVFASQEKTAVYAYALLKGKKGIYVNFLININRLCDCASTTQPILIPDLGILISDDPVALDKASLDWVNQAYGKNLFEEVNGNDGLKILETAEKLGLGSQKYEIAEVL
jgi:uncharacterized Fe-S center protein